MTSTKAIIWKNRLHFLGPNSYLEIGADSIQIESEAGIQFLKYSDNTLLVKRLEEDSRFRGLFEVIVFHVMSNFLNHQSMAVLDLPQYLVNVKIEDKDVSEN